MSADAAQPLVPPLDSLLADLVPMDELARIRHLRTVIRALVDTGASNETKDVYRDGLAEGRFITKGKFTGLERDARREHRDQRRAERIDARTQVDAAKLYRGGRDGCLYVLRPDGEWQMVATFVPRIVASIRRDDGSGPAGVTKTYRIRVTLPSGQWGDEDVPGDRLADVVDWSTSAAGHRAVVLPVPSARDHVRAAAQLLASDDTNTQTVYVHTGWRMIGERTRYLTASGALGADGLDDTATVDLAGALGGFHLPDPATLPADDLQHAVRASLAILDIAPDTVTVPTLGAALRAALPLTPDGGVWIVGRTGSGKSQLAALAQQHYGAGLDDRHFPGAWASTANALAEKAFLLANALYVVDDYIPTGSQQDIARMQKAADHLIRGSANSAGRDRLDATATLRASRPPRAQVLATGEDLPPGHSLRGRLYIAELGHDALNWDALTICQHHARDGIYALAFAGYIRWLAAQMDADPGFADALAVHRTQLRAAATTAGQHRKTPDMVASLTLGWRVWLDYAATIGAITTDQREALYLRVWHALITGADTQADAQQDANPVRIYLDSLKASIVGGHAHLTDLDGRCPPRAPAWGWVSELVGGDLVDRPRGSRIGWVDQDHVYLDPDAAYAMAVRHGRSTGLPALPGESTLRKRLHDAGILASVEQSSGKTRLAVRRTVDGARRAQVLHLHASSLGVEGVR
ncbi:hypothetical protein [Frankia sp. Cas3]|uniref:hypothetical protein n=1 Tax=Frankia sp. Cas3 TaxID=3073926 RepID=UPI002AD52D7A|nr:hypothetical protein [Frankia sp. Cas3]